ncbi:siderophore ABC transporter substrate-binding protein [Vibrio rumoiensis]|uniref:Enterochelin ABC transporter substrate-binding protein n=1 Tax=Vibrio rumoiensis 1S-45 TaxID=1188252 RepID=A0A1E5E5C0_9VIBR|nr:ABC transporter substrate-binding protein [Vibrio rumoiensis]OEF28116.1 enterochelin ABC transporter substrate-binding protein [Vibrio rumoiensis 1S-45]
MKRFILLGLAAATLASAFPLTAKTITVDHIMGSTTIETSPQRVVVIGVGALDAIDALGIKPVAVSKGVVFPSYLTQYDDKSFASAGTIFEPDFEAIYSQKPDLIIVGPRSSKHFKELSKIAPTFVFAVENGTDYWKHTQAIWHDLGDIFDKETLVDQTIETLNQRFTAIKNYNQSHNLDALMLMSSGGNVTSFGEGSRFSILYQDFGFKPTIDVSDKKSDKTGGHGQLVSYELVSQENPSTLLILDRDKLVNKGKSTTRQDFDNELVKSTDAYKNHRMVYLDIPAWYVASSGITATQTMIEDIESLTKTQ